jgi:hypothetical protein
MKILIFKKSHPALDWKKGEKFKVCRDSDSITLKRKKTGKKYLYLGTSLIKKHFSERW